MQPSSDVPTNLSCCLYAGVDDLKNDIGENIRGGNSLDGVFRLKSTKDRVVQVLESGIADRPATMEDMEMLLNANGKFIIRCHQILTDDTCVYAVLDYYPKYLHDVLSTRKAHNMAIDLDTFLNIAHDIAHGLAYFHNRPHIDENNVPVYTCFHGNLKSSTIMLNEDETRCVLTYPKFHVRLSNRGEEIVRSVRYAAPEVLNGAKYSQAADMWNLGVVLYELAGGNLRVLPGGGSILAASPTESFLDTLSVNDTFIKQILRYLLVPDPHKRITIMPLLHILELYRDNLRKLDEIRGLEEMVRQAEQESLRCAMVRETQDRGNQVHIAVHTTTDTSGRDKNKPNPSISEGHGPLLTPFPEENGGVTALMRSADSGNVWFTRLYLPTQAGRVTTVGESINGWGLKGRTALMGAALHNRVDVVKILAPYEAGIQQKCDNATALMMAAFMGHEEVVKILLDREKGMVDDSGYTALIYAVLQKHLSIVSILAPYEARVQSTDGSTALMMAVSIKYTDAVDILAPREAGLRNNKGYTAKMIAKQNGFSDLEEMLTRCEDAD